MDQPICISLFEHERDRTPQPHAFEWAQLAALLTHHDRRPSDPCPACNGTGLECKPCKGSGSTDSGKSGPAFVPAEFKPGSTRLAVNVDRVTVGVFDLDERGPKQPITPEDFERVLGAIDAAGVAAVVHSSYRYTPARPKCRIAFKLSRPILPGENVAFRAAVEKRFGFYNDPSTKDPGRLYFLPAAPPDAEVFAATTDGLDALNVDELLGSERIASVTARAETIANDKLAEARAAALANTEPVDLERLRKLLASAGGRNSDLLKRVLRGDLLAEEGGRDDTLNRACAAARFAVNPSTPTDALLAIFSESLSKFERKITPTGELEDWFEEARKKLDRALERRIAHDAARAATNEEIFGRLRAEAAKSGHTPVKRSTSQAEAPDAPGSSETVDTAPSAVVGPYAEADLAEWARVQKCADVLDFQRRWIITRADSFYVFVEGRYLPPIPRANLEHSIVRDLARAPVQLFATDQRGNTKMREVRAVLHDYSTVARAVEASLSLQTSFYEPESQTFYEATTPLRRLPARFHAEVDAWLRTLDPSERLLDWVATASRLDRQSCAVYIDGPGGIGKTLLASGLARLWTTGGPSELARVLDGFNESLIACPLVLADEALPTRKGITAELRRFIGSTKRTLNRKFLPAAPLEGAVRVIIAGNNDRLLDTGEELSTNDLEAIAGRIYYLRADKRPADYLASIGGPPKIQRWIDEDMIAEHSLWLGQNRTVNEGARFLVEGNASEFHRHLATGAGMASLVCEWLARFLADANPLPTALVQVGSGEVWVNTEALAKETNWTRYVPSVKVPTAAQLGRALRSLSHEGASATLNGKATTYHRIEADLILNWVERLQIGDVSAIRAKLESLNEVIHARKGTNPHV